MIWMRGQARFQRLKKAWLIGVKADVANGINSFTDLAQVSVI